MKRRTALKISLAVVAVLVSSQLAAAQSQNNQTPGAPTFGSASARQISAVRSKDTASGSQVTITSDETLTEYGAHRNGEYFVIVIPQASLALNNVNVSGTAFLDARLEARGADLVFSFHMGNGVSASVSQRANQLEVNFTRLEVATLRGDLEPASEATGTDPEPSRATAPPRREPTDAPPANRGSGARNKETAGGVANPALVAPQQPAADGNITKVDVDLSVPESPAFTVLGVTPENVSLPTTPREFATSFLNGVDQRGNFQTGLALDFVPFLTFFGKDTSLFSYSRNRMERFLARTQFSFATTKGVTEEDKSTRVALGLRMTLWDKGDPRLDSRLEDCYDKADEDDRFENDEYVPEPGVDSPEVQANKLLKRKQLLAELTKPCDDAARKRNWNASGWIVGAAPSWISPSGQTTNFLWNGGGFWTSLAYGFENVGALKDNSQLILHARHRNNESVADPDNTGQFFLQDSSYFGGRLRIAPGDEAKSILSLEGNLIRSRRNKGAFDNSSRYSLGLEQRLADNIWFSLSLGGQRGRSDGSNQAFVLSSFKWGFSQKR